MKEYDGLLYSEDYRILHGQIKKIYFLVKSWIYRTSRFSK